MPNIIDNNSPWKSEQKTRERYRVAKRNAAISAATRQFKTHGYASTSMDDIASELGISKPTLYRLFKGKEDLLYASQMVVLDQLKDLAADLLTADTSAVARLRDFFGQVIVLTAAEPGTVYFQLAEMGVKDEPNRQHLRAARKEVQTNIRTIVRQGIDSGEIQQDLDEKYITLAMFGACNSVAGWFRPGGAETVEEVSDHFLKILFHGLLLGS